ncbi:hypothetical protein TrST_g9510 [Triparma strigata]|uniref:Uncharacterized protein n=1 Tax=Triparma strigata TaxID=1606541 RepID=A0A9W7EGY0_9STRA|nr:hypothetical protein TrST_g9510 [Triparma strigata]
MDWIILREFEYNTSHFPEQDFGRSGKGEKYGVKGKRSRERGNLELFEFDDSMRKNFGLVLARLLGYTWGETDPGARVHKFHTDRHKKGSLCQPKVILHFGNRLRFSKKSLSHLNIENSGVQVLFIGGELLVERHRGLSRALGRGRHFVLGGLSRVFIVDGREKKVLNTGTRDSPVYDVELIGNFLSSYLKQRLALLFKNNDKTVKKPTLKLEDLKRVKLTAAEEMEEMERRKLKREELLEKINLEWKQFCEAEGRNKRTEEEKREEREEREERKEEIERIERMVAAYYAKKAEKKEVEELEELEKQRLRDPRELAEELERKLRRELDGEWVAWCRKEELKLKKREYNREKKRESREYLKLRRELDGEWVAWCRKEEMVEEKKREREERKEEIKRIERMVAAYYAKKAEKEVEEVEAKAAEDLAKAKAKVKKAEAKAAEEKKEAGVKKRKAVKLAAKLEKKEWEETVERIRERDERNVEEFGTYYTGDDMEGTTIPEGDGKSTEEVLKEQQEEMLASMKKC